MKTANAIKLIRYSNTEWGVLSYSSTHTGRGTLKKAAKALMNLGVSFGEFEEAITELETKGHNVADFGVVNKTFMYTTQVALDTPTPPHTAKHPAGNA